MEIVCQPNPLRCDRKASLSIINPQTNSGMSSVSSSLKRSLLASGISPLKMNLSNQKQGWATFYQQRIGRRLTPIRSKKLLGL